MPMDNILKNAEQSEEEEGFICLFKILKTIQSRTPYKRGAKVKRIYKIYLQKVPKNKRNLNKRTTSNIKCRIIK